MLMFAQNTQIKGAFWMLLLAHKIQYQTHNIQFIKFKISRFIFAEFYLQT